MRNTTTKIGFALAPALVAVIGRSQEWSLEEENNAS